MGKYVTRWELYPALKETFHSVRNKHASDEFGIFKLQWNSAKNEETYFSILIAGELASDVHGFESKEEGVQHFLLLEKRAVEVLDKSSADRPNLWDLLKPKAKVVEKQFHATLVPTIEIGIEEIRFAARYNFKPWMIYAALGMALSPEIVASPEVEAIAKRWLGRISAPSLSQQKNAFDIPSSRALDRVYKFYLAKKADAIKAQGEEEMARRKPSPNQGTLFAPPPPKVVEREREPGEDDDVDAGPPPAEERPSLLRRVVEEQAPAPAPAPAPRAPAPAVESPIERLRREQAEFFGKKW